MALTEYYVDPSAGNDTTGDGSIGTPWKTTQKALTTGTLGTDGTRVNVKDSADDVLTAALTTTMTPTSAAPIVIQGYTTAADDKGRGVLDGDALYSIWVSTTQDYIRFIDITFQNCGSRRILQLDDWIALVRVHVLGTATPGDTAVQLGNAKILVSDCRFETQNAIQLNASNGLVCGNYFAGDVATRHGDFNDAFVFNNIVYSTGGDGFKIGNEQGFAANNSILASSPGTVTVGIECSGQFALVERNIVEGYSQASAVGIKGTSSTGNTGIAFLSNYGFNNADDFSEGIQLTEADNEDASVTAFAKDGAITYANRLTYFAPADVGNVLSPTFGQYKGAVAPTAGGGGGGLLTHPGMSGGMRG